MTSQSPADFIVMNAKEPMSLVASPTGFGGTLDQDFFRGGLLVRTGQTTHRGPPFGCYLPTLTTSAESAHSVTSTHLDRAVIGDPIRFGAATPADILAGASAPKPITIALHGELA
ncbi:MAG: hypothetical protein QNJ44_20920 [Rhodobacter sp.]|nr:hypothetical protein [Rhodobacter sp.]